MPARDDRRWIVAGGAALALAAWLALGPVRPTGSARARGAPTVAGPATRPVPRLSPAVVSPSPPASSPGSAEDGAREAVAEAMGGYVIRCPLPHVEGRRYRAPDDEPTSRVDDGFVTLVVETPTGRKALWTEENGSLPGLEAAPDAWLDWAGAQPGVESPCTVTRGRRYRIRVDAWIPPDAVRASLHFTPCGWQEIHGDPPWDVDVLGGWPEPCVFGAIASLPDGEVVATATVPTHPEEVRATVHLGRADPVKEEPGAEARLRAAADEPAADPDTPIAVALERDDLDDRTRAVLLRWRAIEVKHSEIDHELMRAIAGPEEAGGGE